MLKEEHIKIQEETYAKYFAFKRAQIEWRKCWIKEHIYAVITVPLALLLMYFMLVS